MGGKPRKTREKMVIQHGARKVGIEWDVELDLWQRLVPLLYLYV